MLGSVFVSFIFNGNSGGFVYEHASFMTVVMAHIGFFALESPDPLLQFKVDDGYVPLPSSEIRPRITPGDVKA